MTIRENKFPVKDIVVPQHVLVSVFGKQGLDTLVAGVLACNPDAMFYSTGGTGKRIGEILGDRAGTNYTSVEQFTKAPEMEGGLVKTLHPKLHAGLLAERNNPHHTQYLLAMQGVYFDMMVGNLYPFGEVVAKPDCTGEQARINIDIGGPAMLMAAAKNWHSVAVVSSPDQYQKVARFLHSYEGIPLELRFRLAQQALTLVGNYRAAIANHFEGLDFATQVLPHLELEKA
ncbi:MAG TPA: hypothetical protein VJH37_03000 [Candidatus Nanoarchaeia archaeon]|nr:hypothetical protein [Candidatus Nanoarchaeia archaeon]